MTGDAGKPGTSSTGEFPGAPSETSDGAIPGRRRAAILLTSLGDEASAAILRQLSEEQVQDLTREISALRRLSAEEQTAVLTEFVAAAGDPNALVVGGVEYATSVLLAAFGPESGKRMAERLLRSVGGDATGADVFRRVDPQQLSKFVQREHPQTLALLLSNLDPPKAARVFSELPQSLRAQVARRMASLDQVSPDVSNRLGKMIGSKLRVMDGSGSESFGGTRTVAELLNRVDPAMSEAILKEITTDDPPLGDEIRQIMFVFDDLLNVGPEALRKLLGKADRKVLTLALKGANPQIKKQFTAAMSQRAAQMLTEDMEALGAVRVKEVQAARQALVATARAMSEAGEISLTAGTEEYVE